MNDAFVNIGQRVRVGVLLVQDGLIMSGGGSVPQAFFYVATGAEGASFTVVIPSRMSSTSYLARATGAGLANFLAFDAPRANYQADRFRLDCSAAPQAGDVIAITVESL